MHGTNPEIALRRELHRRGLRFYVEYHSAAGRPDLAFPSLRLAVFVDGDVWHGHAERRVPDAWRPKIDANVHRDAVVNARLRDQGWTVLRIWESDIRRNLDACVEAVTRAAGR
jgi:DNA mismatch endonuclease (patch repair protein)